MWRKLTDEEKMLFIHHEKNVLKVMPVTSVIINVVGIGMAILGIFMIIFGVLNKEIISILTGVLLIICMIKIVSTTKKNKRNAEVAIKDLETDSAYLFEGTILKKKSRKNSGRVLVEIMIEDHMEQRWIQFYLINVFHTLKPGDKVLIFRTVNNGYGYMIAYDLELSKIRASFNCV